MASLRETETASIREFLQSHADKLTGRVLDYGCGKQPYRDIVEAVGGEYHAYDNPVLPASTAVGTYSHLGAVQGDLHAFDAVISTQVLQYTDDPEVHLRTLHDELRPGGWLLMTGPTNWPVVEVEDLWRFTPAGVATLIIRSPFTGPWHVTDRHAIDHGGERWLCGWAVAAQA